ncbi:uncharacterized protein LY79DRAFT_34147 [Colletotrichum navitas]|uniref:Uncharacterized protein n=1 Tax=Colletotrichum navitas TaxID=681940 RepID=A0AAD8V9T9_9PEZI|nr:uncharacterized protein LY79DRAFT_34147 [Colletotrichum navitas]KAK1596870.1 hypothetical protein LY79DRAFT_34147 [Colletotrichum navitas]
MRGKKGKDTSRGGWTEANLLDCLSHSDTENFWDPLLAALAHLFFWLSHALFAAVAKSGWRSAASVSKSSRVPCSWNPAKVITLTKVSPSTSNGRSELLDFVICSRAPKIGQPKRRLFILMPHMVVLVRTETVHPPPPRLPHIGSHTQKSQPDDITRHQRREKEKRKRGKKRRNEVLVGRQHGITYRGRLHASQVTVKRLQVLRVLPRQQAHLPAHAHLLANVERHHARGGDGGRREASDQCQRPHRRLCFFFSSITADACFLLCCRRVDVVGNPRWICRFGLDSSRPPFAQVRIRDRDNGPP